MDFIIFINYCVLSGEPRHLHIVPSRTGALLLALAQPGGEAACPQDVLHVPAAPRADTPGYGGLSAAKYGDYSKVGFLALSLSLGYMRSSTPLSILRTDILQRDLLLSLEILTNCKLYG